MKITMSRVLSIKQELEALFMKDIPIKASWKISKFIRQIETEYNDFETNRMKILDKYLDKEVGRVPEDKQEAFRKDMECLLDVEVELDVETIDIKDLGDISLPPLSLAKMAFLFSESENLPETQDISPEE